MRVLAADLRERGIFPGERFHANIEILLAFQQEAAAEAGLAEALRLSYILRRNRFEDLQRPLRVAADRSEDRRGVHALHSAGVGHGDALHVFENIAAEIHVDPFRLPAESLSSLAGGIGDGDRFGAAERRDQLAAKDIGIGAVSFRSHGLYLR